MPQHTEYESSWVGGFNCLDAAVITPCHRFEPDPDGGNSLVVVRRHTRLVAEQMTEPAALVDPDVVVTVSAECRAMPIMADHVRKMLMQSAAVCHRDELRTATDSENRPAQLERRFHQRQLTVIPFRPDTGGLWMRPGSIHRRADVAATAHNQSVKYGQRLLGTTLVWWQEHRSSPGAGDGIEVACGQQCRRLIPDPPARVLFDRSRHSDDRPGQYKPPCDSRRWSRLYRRSRR
jgi:hypothetical protein